MPKLVAKMLNFCKVIKCYQRALYNYFDDSTKLFSNLYLAKFLDTLFFPCANYGCTIVRGMTSLI